MANRTYDQDSFQIIRRMVTLFADITIAEAGTPVPVLNKWNYPTFGGGPVARTYTAAPTAATLPTGSAYPKQYEAGAEGVLSIVRTAAGLYTLRLQDNYQRLMGLSFFIASAAGASLVGKLNENTTISNYLAPSGSIIGLAFLDFAGVAVDPIGHVRLSLVLADSTAP